MMFPFTIISVSYSSMYWSYHTEGRKMDGLWIATDILIFNFFSSIFHFKKIPLFTIQFDSTPSDLQPAFDFSKQHPTQKHTILDVKLTECHSSKTHVTILPPNSLCITSTETHSQPSPIRCRFLLYHGKSLQKVTFSAREDVTPKHDKLKQFSSPHQHPHVTQKHPKSTITTNHNTPNPNHFLKIS